MIDVAAATNARFNAISAKVREHADEPFTSEAFVKAPQQDGRQDRKHNTPTEASSSHANATDATHRASMPP